MSFSAWSVIAGEVPTASKWNILGSNDSDFNTRLLAIEPIKMNFAFGLEGALSVANSQGMRYPCPFNCTASKILYKTTSGTATLRIKKDATEIGSWNATSSLQSSTTFSSPNITANQLITLDITAVSSGVDIWVCLTANK